MNLNLEERNFIDGAAWRDEMPYDEYQDALDRALGRVAAHNPCPQQFHIDLVERANTLGSLSGLRVA